MKYIPLFYPILKSSIGMKNEDVTQENLIEMNADYVWDPAFRNVIVKRNKVLFDF
jgi:hypothetical protein